MGRNILDPDFDRQQQAGNPDPDRVDGVEAVGFIAARMAKLAHTHPGTPVTVLIDGHSGAGKTTLAEQLGEHTGVTVVHMDDFYPGWSGLAAGSRMIADGVLSRSGAHFIRWDWVRDCPGETVCVDEKASLVVEGSGALTPATLAAAAARGAVLTVRVVCDDAERKTRALERDPGYAAFWDMWAAQEDIHCVSSPGEDITVTT